MVSRHEVLSQAGSAGWGRPTENDSAAWYAVGARVVTQQTELRVEEHVKLVDLDSEDAGEDVVAKLVYDDEKGQGDYKLESFYDK